MKNLLKMKNQINHKQKETTITSKICTQCKLNLPLNVFILDKRRSDGHGSWCRKCRYKIEKTANRIRQSTSDYREYNRKYQKKYNSDPKNKEKHRIYCQTDRYKQYLKNYGTKNRKRIGLYKRNQYKNNPQYKLSELLRTRINKLLRRKGGKSGSAVRDLGCTLLELRIHIEKQFVTGMSWTNHGEWHIDHKKPLKSFDLTDRKQFLEACHYTNLQPLWAKDNILKGSKE